MDPDCDFCDIVRKEESSRDVLRTANIVAFFPLEPATLGHTLVIPRIHIPDLWALDEDTAQHIALATMKVARAVRDAMKPDGLNIIQSNGQAATQTVPHLHVHVVPRWDRDAMGDIWPKNTEFSSQDKDEACRMVRAAVRGSQRG